MDGEKHAHALQQVVTSPDRARRLVRNYQSDGYDLIKAYGYLDGDVFKAIMSEAKTLNMPVAMHGPNPVDNLPLQSNQGLQSLEHVEDISQGPLNFSFDRQTLEEWVKEFKMIQPVVTPTLATFDHLTQLSEHKNTFVASLPLETLNPLYKAINSHFEVKRWLGANEEQTQWNKKEQAFLLEIVKLLDDEDIVLLVGSDAGTLYMPPGVSTHREMALMVEAGLTPLTVIQAATANAARALGVDDRYGTIEVGKVADLLIVGSSSLSEI